MFDVGFGELVLLFIIGLLILGPERLPRVATQIGRWVGRARRTATQLRHQLEREMAMADIRKQPPKKPGEADPGEEKPREEERAEEQPPSEQAGGAGTPETGDDANSDSTAESDDVGANLSARDSEPSEDHDDAKHG